MKCPACGNELRPAVKCGKYNALICQSHCNENGGCEYSGGHETSIEHCYYRDRIIERWQNEAARYGVSPEELGI